MMLTFDYRRCPKCNSTDTVCRRGLHFKEMRRCCDCGECWDLDDELELYRQSEIERLELNTHRE